MTLLDIIMAQIVGKTLLYISMANEAQEDCYGKVVESVSLAFDGNNMFVLHFTDGSQVEVEATDEVRFSG